MSKSFCLIHQCAGCDLEIEVTEENSTEFQLAWYESILFDLCPACQRSPEGMRKISVDLEIRKTGRERMEKRLIQENKSAH